MPATVQTAESLVDRQTAEPPRAQRRSWVAVEGSEVIGFAVSYFQWFGGEVGKARLWVGVRDDRRRQGIGTSLWNAAVANAAGAKKLTVEVDDDPAGLRFVERRGFSDYDSEVISSLDPQACDAKPDSAEGFRIVRLGDVRDRASELYEFYGAAGGIPVGDPENRVSLDEWRRFILENPLLDDEASVVVEDAGGRTVSLSWLLVDRERRRAENEWTATLPQLRNRGLARLAKVASIRAAAELGIAEIVTGNDPDNLPMRELNLRLGYRELFIRRDLELAVGTERARVPGGPAR
jgi:GNAT superfamily N-acetyltransferase